MKQNYIIGMGIGILVIVIVAIVVISYYNSKKKGNYSQEPVGFPLKPCFSCGTPGTPPASISGNPYYKKPCHKVMYTDKDPDQYYSVLVNGQESYPCNDCYQPWNQYGGVKSGANPKVLDCAGDAIAEGAGMNQCEIVDVENRLNRTSKVFTRCKGLSTFDILL